MSQSEAHTAVEPDREAADEVWLEACLDKYDALLHSLRNA